MCCNSSVGTRKLLHMSVVHLRSTLMNKKQIYYRINMFRLAYFLTCRSCATCGQIVLVSFCFGLILNILRFLKDLYYENHALRQLMGYARKIRKHVCIGFAIGFDVHCVILCIPTLGQNCAKNKN